MKFKRKNYVAQIDEKDCGVAALAMILRHFGSEIPLSKIREIAQTTLEGTTALGLLHAAEHFGLGGRAVQTDLTLLLHHPECMPMIVHVMKEGKFPHYYVLLRCTLYEVTIADPDPSKGIIRMPMKTFLEEWTQVAIVLAPAPSYEPKKEQKYSLLDLLPIIIKKKSLLLCIVLASFLIWVMTIGTSFYVQWVIDSYIPNRSLRMLSLVSIGILGTYVFQQMMHYAKEYLLLILGQRLSVEVMLSYVRHIYQLPMQFFSTRRTGEITSRFQDASVIIETLARGMMSVSVDSVVILSVAIVLFFQNATLFLFSLIALPLYVIVLWIFSPLFSSQSYETMESGAIVSSSIIEDINGIETIKSLAMEKERYGKIDTEFVVYLENALKQSQTMVLQAVLKKGIQLCMQVALVWLGAQFVMNHELTVGQLLTFQALMAYFNVSFEEILQLQPALQKASVANQRLNEVFTLEKESNSEESIRDRALLRGNIEVKHVNYQYGFGKQVLKDVSMTIHSNEKICIVGCSGSGKSTLAKLLVHFYGVTSGEILYNGFSVNSIHTKTLRRQIHYLSGKPYIFSGTVLENIMLGAKSDIRSEEVYQALDLCCIRKDIEALPQHYATQLTSDSTILSGGQLQRIALARAILSGAEVLILDESTSQLDLLTERKVLDGLLQLECTIIFIAHRSSIAKRSQRIFVMDRGEIVEEGSHDELMAQSSFYRQLFEKGE